MQNMNKKELNVLQEALKMQSESNENYISDKDLEAFSARFSLSKAEVIDCLSFYEHISFEPRGKHIIRFCKTPCCKFSGEEQIMEKVKDYLGIEINQTDSEGCFTLELTNCIGACDHAPAMTIDDTLYGDLTVESVITIIERIRNNNA